MLKMRISPVRLYIALCLGLALAGCGRRGALEAPPDANARHVNEATVGDTDPLAVQRPKRKKATKVTPVLQSTPLDWLL